jgi:hypothetical protein
MTTNTATMTATELTALLNGLADTRDLALAAAGDGVGGAAEVADQNNQVWLRLAGEGLQRFGAEWVATLRV